MLLIDYLAQKYPSAKKQTLRRMVEDGRVLINGRRAKRIKEPLKDLDKVVVADKPQKAAPTLAPLTLIHEDADILVVQKPPGLLTSTNPGEKRPTAIAAVRNYLSLTDPSARPGIIHRLDRDASGLLVFSKNAAAFEQLKKQFFDHTVERTYLAAVHGKPPNPGGRIESSLVEYPDGSVHSTRLGGKGQQAVTDYVLLKESGGLSLLRVTLHTGRKHQIRAHLSEMRTPIVNDSVYGSDREPQGPLMLAAVVLSLDHPRTGERLKFEIAPPPHLTALFHDGG